LLRVRLIRRALPGLPTRIEPAPAHEGVNRIIHFPHEASAAAQASLLAPQERALRAQSLQGTDLE
jgi:hypothetical protein